MGEFRENQFGVLSYYTTCAVCGNDFGVTPAPDNPERWQVCLSEDCDSYDPDRDPVGRELFPTDLDQ